MYGPDVRRSVIAMAEAGRPIKVIGRQLGISRAAIREWITDPDRALAPRPGGTCFACTAGDCPHPETYAYLLGQYLGDGHLVTSTHVPVLRIYACADYPKITTEIIAAITAVRGTTPGNHATASSERLRRIQSYWKHWPCLFPQHGPGMKHTRPIVLAAWQQRIVDQQPWPLIRGLIHSDGCRAINRVVVRGVRYEYPRYFFSNRSRDILAIMGDALDRVGVAWRYNRPISISVAKRDAVALMDAQVGPKS